MPRIESDFAFETSIPPQVMQLESDLRAMGGNAHKIYRHQNGKLLVCGDNEKLPTGSTQIATIPTGEIVGCRVDDKGITYDLVHHNRGTDRALPGDTYSCYVFDKGEMPVYLRRKKIR